MDREMGRERIRKKIKLYSSTESSVRKNCIGKKREAVYNKLKFRAFFVTERTEECRMSKFGSKNKDSKKAEEKRMKQQLAALARKNDKKKKK